jgi:hypothetical protein
VRLIRWFASSLSGHVTFAIIVAGIPFFLLFLPMIRREWGLTFSSVMYLVLWSAAAWGLCGVMLWYAISKPLRHRRGQK